MPSAPPRTDTPAEAVFVALIGLRAQQPLNAATGQDTGHNTDQYSGKAYKDHKGLIYVITGSILALGIAMMAFYDRAGADGA